MFSPPAPKFQGKWISKTVGDDWFYYGNNKIGTSSSSNISNESNCKL